MSGCRSAPLRAHSALHNVSSARPAQPCLASRPTQPSRCTVLQPHTPRRPAPPRPVGGRRPGQHGVRGPLGEQRAEHHPLLARCRGPQAPLCVVCASPTPTLALTASMSGHTGLTAMAAWDHRLPRGTPAMKATRRRCLSGTNKSDLLRSHVTSVFCAMRCVGPIRGGVAH